VLTATAKKVSANATLTGSKTSQAQIDCQSFGGTYATGTVLGVFWTCNGYTDTDTTVELNTEALRFDCERDNGALIPRPSSADDLRCPVRPGSVVLAGQVLFRD
jgi:hypothetical protein